MKQLTWKLILPLTVISFSIFTKWWYILPVDAPDTLAYGFPLPFVSGAWHTSMALQIFILEFFIDFLVYFLFWFVIVFCIRKFLMEKRIYKFIPIGLWIISGMLILFAFYITFRPVNIIYFMRPYDMEILETGYKFLWQHTERPDLNKYYLK